MKLDKDLVREILLVVEASEEDPRASISLVVEGKTPMVISYHVMLLHEAGLLVGQSHNHLGPGGFIWEPKHLTYRGHEFLDTVRDGEVWRRTKAGAEKAGVAGLGVLLELGKAYGKEVLKEKLGIELS
ncbi:hypothetical protein HK44_002085 [Pseudomonas fluorescens HK44]|uniref:DUF2513 domain-containing protein n=1 Tax=Pseudomonas fluorescens HK44 TaxID=1042209 RepID=A0A010SN41_PSEFL|nr:DUF2513 domain-containing protein [Pseudomonas fluorescens]EXF94305.1 hypothetical protein HK44_002085 [Pseudomonas fluorescens HK44]